MRLLPRVQPLRELVSEYAGLSNSIFFERQFGRPINKIEEVIASVEAAAEAGFSSYFDLHLRTSNALIGHIRVDWSIETEGLISLHGGAPYGIRGQARARLEAWMLMVSAALNTVGVQRIGTATSLSNKQAQTFIAASGFRRTRILHLTDQQEPMVHYRLVSQWFTPTPSRIPSPQLSLDKFKPTLKRSALSPKPPSEVIAAPSGWHHVTEVNQDEWLSVFNGRHWFLQHLARQLNGSASATDMLQLLRFEAMCGTQFMGHYAGGQVDGLISLQTLPGRPGWCYLRGGAVLSSCPVYPVKEWLDQLFKTGRLRRAEAQSPAQTRSLHAWWMAMGFVEEGATEVDPTGLAIEMAFARLSA